MFALANYRFRTHAYVYKYLNALAMNKHMFRHIFLQDTSQSGFKYFISISSPSLSLFYISNIDFSLFISTSFSNKNHLFLIYFR